MLSTFVAASVLACVAGITVWAFARRPGRLAGDDFLHVWSFSAWGKQFMVDFWGLELMLALWMIPHAIQNDHEVLVAVCLLLMPVFGAMPAATYWLIAVSA